MKWFKNKVLMNTLWIAAGQATELLIGLVFGVLIARYLGPEQYGMMHYAISLMNFFIPLASLSINGIIVKELLLHPEQEGEILGTLFIFRFIASIISALLLQLVVQLLNPGDSLVYFLVFLQSIVLIFNGYELITYWYNSKLKSKTITVLRLISCVLVCIYKGAILYFQKDVAWFCFSNVLDAIILTIITYISYRINNGQKFKVSFSYGFMMIKQSYFYVISGTLVALTTQVDKILIGQYLSDYAVGLYTTAIYLATIWGFVLNAMIESTRPTIIESKAIGKELYQKRLRQLYAVIVWSGILVSIGITIFSKWIITFLYGIEYQSAYQALAILSWSVPFIYLAKARSIWLISEDKNKYDLLFGIFGVIFNVGVNSFIIPNYGINGAAVTSGITQILISIVFPLFFSETRESSLLMIQAIFFKKIT